MNQNNAQKKKLISEVKEQILYLAELGVNEITYDIPGSPIIIERKDTSGKATPARIDEIVSGIQKQAQTAAPIKIKPRRDLLNSTRISDVSKNTEVPVRNIKSGEETIAKPIKQVLEQKVQVLSPNGETLDDIRSEIGADCSRCGLCEGRTQVVNSVGSEQANLMVIGEAPGADEDVKGEPFVGRAGKLLTKILESIGFERPDVFIGNINRCRPPGNRQPTLEESTVCKPFLLREIAVVQPKVIVVLGNTATKNLLDTKTGITKLRGNFEEFCGVKVMPTFHPAYLLRDPRKKREVWEDMKKVKAYLESVSE